MFRILVRPNTYIRQDVFLYLMEKRYGYEIDEVLRTNKLYHPAKILTLYTKDKYISGYSVLPLGISIPDYDLFDDLDDFIEEVLQTPTTIYQNDTEIDIFKNKQGVSIDGTVLDKNTVKEIYERLFY